MLLEGVVAGSGDLDPVHGRHAVGTTTKRFWWSSLQQLPGNRGSRSRAKKLDAGSRIAFVHFGSRFSASSCRIRSGSAVVGPAGFTGVDRGLPAPVAHCVRVHPGVLSKPLHRRVQRSSLRPPPARTSSPAAAGSCGNFRGVGMVILPGSHTLYDTRGDSRCGMTLSVLRISVAVERNEFLRPQPGPRGGGVVPFTKS